MNKEVKEKWLEALRSGEYEQGRERLRSGDKFCCLGVLCEIYRKDMDNGEWRTYDKDDILFQTGATSKFGTLPRVVINWSELPDDNPNVTHDGMVNTLASLNDNGESFETIADVIEKNL
jgi:hypothetical protein